MDVLTLLLIAVILILVFGGARWPAPNDGSFPFGGLLYLLAFVVLVVLVLRLVGVLV